MGLGGESLLAVVLWRNLVPAFPIDPSLLTRWRRRIGIGHEMVIVRDYPGGRIDQSNSTALRQNNSQAGRTRLSTMLTLGNTSVCVVT